MLQTQLSNQYAQFGWNCIRKPFNFKHLYYSSKIINDKICQWRASYYLQNKNLNFIFFVSILWGSMDITSCLIKGTYCHAGLRTVMGSAVCLKDCLPRGAIFFIYALVRVTWYLKGYFPMNLFLTSPGCQILPWMFRVETWLTVFYGISRTVLESSLKRSERAGGKGMQARGKGWQASATLPGTFTFQDLAYNRDSLLSSRLCYHTW